MNNEEKTTRPGMVGTLVADALIGMVHLFYQKNTATNFLKSLIWRLQNKYKEFSDGDLILLKPEPTLVDLIEQLENMGYGKNSSSNTYNNMVGNCILDLKRTRSELRKWEREHDDKSLQLMKGQSKQKSLAAKQAYINALEHHLKCALKEIDKVDKVYLKHKRMCFHGEIFPVIWQAVKELSEWRERVREGIQDE